jgi:NTE family protein
LQLKDNYLKIGLALGGGGARGLAHVGVIKALERKGISIDFIAGTSVGSVVGAFYALYKDSQKLQTSAQILADKMNQYQNQFDFNQFEKDDKKILPWVKLTDFIKRGYYLHTELRKTCLNDGKIMEKLFSEVLGGCQFYETKLPFIAVAADLISGKEVFLNKGKIIPALMASCAIPGVFPPVQFQSYLLVDGGIIDNVPIKAVKKMGANFVIASNISKELKRKTEYKNAIDILLRSEEITSKELRKVQLETADFVISPEIHHIDWWNFSKPEQCMRLGEEAANKVIAELQKIIRKRQIKTGWKRLFSSIK